MDKKPLAEKSIKFIVSEAMGIIVCVSLAVLTFFAFFNTGEILGLICGILFSVIAIVAIFLVFSTALKPKVVIEQDNYGIYLNYIKKSIYLRYRDIDSVFAWRAKGRNIRYSFGTLYIKTKDKKYHIGIVKDVEKVKKIIEQKIAWKYSTK